MDGSDRFNELKVNKKVFSGISFFLDNMCKFFKPKDEAKSLPAEIIQMILFNCDNRDLNSTVLINRQWSAASVEIAKRRELIPLIKSAKLFYIINDEEILSCTCLSKVKDSISEILDLISTVNKVELRKKKKFSEDPEIKKILPCAVKLTKIKSGLETIVNKSCIPDRQHRHRVDKNLWDEVWNTVQKRRGAWEDDPIESKFQDEENLSMALSGNVSGWSSDDEVFSDEIFPDSRWAILSRRRNLYGTLGRKVIQLPLPNKQSISAEIVKHVNHIVNMIKSLRNNAFQFEFALKQVEKHSEETPVFILEEIWYKLLKDSELDKVTNMVANFMQSIKKENILKKIAIKLARKGLFDEAEDIAKLMEEGDIKKQALQEISVNQEIAFQEFCDN